MALLNEVAHSPGIAVDVSAGKALIGHVEEHKQVPFLYGEKERGRAQERRRQRQQVNNVSNDNS